MIRQTSTDAYNKIKTEGLLTKKRFQIYDLLYVHGPATAGELFDLCRQQDSGHTVVKGSVCARLTELRDQGVVYEAGIGEWSGTGHKSILWDVTANLPHELTKKQKPDVVRENEILKKENAALRKQIEQLTRQPLLRL